LFTRVDWSNRVLLAAAVVLTAAEVAFANVVFKAVAVVFEAVTFNTAGITVVVVFEAGTTADGLYNGLLIKVAGNGIVTF
jgi:hypothetical protein